MSDPPSLVHWANLDSTARKKNQGDQHVYSNDYKLIKTKLYLVFILTYNAAEPLSERT